MSSGNQGRDPASDDFGFVVDAATVSELMPDVAWFFGEQLESVIDLLGRDPGLMDSLNEIDPADYLRHIRWLASLDDEDDRDDLRRDLAGDAGPRPLTEEIKTVRSLLLPLPQEVKLIGFLCRRARLLEEQTRPPAPAPRVRRTPPT
jgi:hypothetical protein